MAARLVSLDVYRGLAVAGMILATNAGNWDRPLLHAIRAPRSRFETCLFWNAGGTLPGLAS